MKFEVVNDKSRVVMHTEYISCIPPKDILNSMSDSGYKFKLDGKIISIKKLNEYLKENTDAQNN